MLSVAVVVGEASGDFLGAELVRELKRKYPDIHIEGIAGPNMQALGCQSLFPMERLAVMGLVEPLARLPELIKMRRSLLAHFLQTKPDVFIGIDAPEFNLSLEKKLKAASIPTLHYVSPSVWAWRPKRIYKIARAVNKMLVLFPFEKKLYQQHNIPVSLVGHPLAKTMPLQPDKQAARKILGLDLRAPIMAILPGSRSMEVERLAEPFLRTAQWCLQQKPELQFIVVMANDKRRKQFEAILVKTGLNLPIKIIDQQTSSALTSADVALVASGTVTLEGLLAKIPMVVAYKVSWLTYMIAKFLVTTKYISLPNIIAHASLIPEYIQQDVNPECLGTALMAYFSAPEKTKSLVEKFTEIHQSLLLDSGDVAAEAVLELVNGRDST